MALTRSLDRETVLVTLLDRLRRMVPFDRASVMLLEEASRVSVRAIFDGDRVVPLTPEVRTEFDPTDHPIVHGILTTGTAVLIPDVRAPPRLEPADGSARRRRAGWECRCSRAATWRGSSRSPSASPAISTTST